MMIINCKKYSKFFKFDRMLISLLYHRRALGLETSIATMRHEGGGGGGGKIPSMISLGISMSEPVVSTNGDGSGEVLAQAVSMDAAMQQRMPRVLSSLKNTSWLRGHHPSHVTTHMWAHCIHDLFPSLTPYVSSLFPLFPSTHSTPSSASQSISSLSATIYPIISLLHHPSQRLGVEVYYAPIAYWEVHSRGGTAPPTSPKHTD